MFVPYTGGTRQIINDMMGKHRKADAKLLSVKGSLVDAKSVARV
jgi:hypothetical protein